MDTAVNTFEQKFKMKMAVLWVNRGSPNINANYVLNEHYYSQVAELNVSCDSLTNIYLIMLLLFVIVDILWIYRRNFFGCS